MNKRHSPWSKQLFRFLTLFFLHFLSPCYGDVGTAAQYSPPYLPTACFGNDHTKFPANQLFAAAGEGIWDNGAACGRRYLVNCITAACVTGETIQITIVDRAASTVSLPSAAGATIVLCNKAYAIIADPKATSINIEYQEF